MLFKNVQHIGEHGLFIGIAGLSSVYSIWSLFPSASDESQAYDNVSDLEFSLIINAV